MHHARELVNLIVPQEKIAHGKKAEDADATEALPECRNTKKYTNRLSEEPEKDVRANLKAKAHVEE